MQQSGESVTKEGAPSTAMDGAISICINWLHSKHVLNSNDVPDIILTGSKWSSKCKASNKIILSLEKWWRGQSTWSTFGEGKRSELWEMASWRSGTGGQEVGMCCSQYFKWGAGELKQRCSGLDWGLIGLIAIFFFCLFLKLDLNILGRKKKR